MQKIIAVDGPCGSGKSTMAKRLAQALGVMYVDTGAMFRAIAAHWQARQLLEASPEIQQHSLAQLKMVYHGESGGRLISIDGVDLTTRIRDHEISQLASLVSQKKFVRTFLLNFQRQLATDRVGVMEGRDIGTVVFPDSFCKIFLTASLEVRAQRRLLELQGANKNFTLEQMMEDVRQRDEQDINRQEAPLKQASDAVLFDTSLLTADEVVAGLVQIVRTKAEAVALKL